MKIIRAGQALALAALLAASLQSYAQGDAASSAPTAATGDSAAPASTKAADRALRRRVLTALAKAKGLHASGITVRVRDGAVSLQGWVPEQAQIEQATQVAKNVAGVTSVTNTLTLSTM